MKHLHVISRHPVRAAEFTLGQKLTLAAGIFDAVAGFLGEKEGSGGNGET